MPPASPALVELALRLRQLRLEHWPTGKLTQARLANALGVSPATVASWENRDAPKLPPRERVEAYGHFFATPRSLSPEPHLVPVDTFTEEEEAAYRSIRDELVRLHSVASGGNLPAPAIARRSWRFIDDGPLTLICGQFPEEETSALAHPADPNYTELLKYADLDALVELWGHVKAENPAMAVSFKLSSGVRPDDLSGHVVVIGGIAWNDVTRRLVNRARLPVRQQANPAVETGEIFVTEIDGAERMYLPGWSETDPPILVEDVGLLIRMPNPYNSSRTLTMCNGIHSRGVLGAVRTLTDRRLLESNEQYIAEHFPANHFGILTRVQVIEGEAMTPDLSIEDTILYQWPTKA